MVSPGLEPETFSVLDWRDNQLHHENSDVYGLPCFIHVSKQIVNLNLTH